MIVAIRSSKKRLAVSLESDETSLVLKRKRTLEASSTKKDLPSTDAPLLKSPSERTSANRNSTVVRKSRKSAPDGQVNNIQTMFQSLIQRKAKSGHGNDSTPSKSKQINGSNENGEDSSSSSSSFIVLTCLCLNVINQENMLAVMNMMTIHRFDHFRRWNEAHDRRNADKERECSSRFHRNFRQNRLTIRRERIHKFGYVDS